MFWHEYWRMLTVTIAAMAIYSVSFRPFIDDGMDQPRELSEQFIRPRTVDHSLREIFHDSDWQLNNPMRLSTRRGETLLFGDLKTIGPHRYEVKPLSIVVPQSSSIPGQRNYLIVTNPAGAEIQSSDDLDWMSGDTPRIESIHLVGDVIIESVSQTSASRQTNWSIRSSYLRIEGQEFRSSQDVELISGGSVVRGRDFTITMRQPLFEASQPHSDEPFSDLDRLELIYVHQVRLALPSGGLLGRREQSAAAFLDVACDRSFVLDFTQLLATFHDNVRIQHSVASQPVDQFVAEKVDLHFKAVKSDASENIASFGADGTQLELSQFAAYGANLADRSRPERWIQIDAPNFAAEMQARFLRILPGERRIYMENRLGPDSETEAAPIHLRREDLQVWAPQIEYKLPSEEDANRHLGSIWAAGPGSAQIDGTDQPWRIDWGSALTLSPDGEEDFISVEGTARVENSFGERYAADAVNLWVSVAREPQSEKQSLEVTPKRLRAAGNVMVVNPQLRAQVAKLAVWFENANTRAVHQPSPSQPSTVDSLSSSGKYVVARKPEDSVPIQQPSETVQSTPVSELLTGSTRGTAVRPSVPVQLHPVSVTGNMLHAQVEQTADGGARLKHLRLDGDFTLTRAQLSPERPYPVTVQGDSCELQASYLENDSDPMFEIALNGSPAAIKLGSGHIKSPQIYVDQRRQVLRIDQAGEAAIPLELLESSSPTATSSVPQLLRPLDTSAAGQPGGAWLSSPLITWGQNLHFDGRQAVFSGGVQIDGERVTETGEVWIAQATGENLVADVSQPIVVGKATSERKLERVQLSNNVLIRARQYVAKQLQATAALSCPVLSYDPSLDRIRAEGPGDLLSHRVSAPGEQSTSPGGGLLTSTAPSSRPSLSAVPLQCIHLNYQHYLDFSIADSSVVAAGEVAAAISPIGDWTDRIDVNRLDRLSSGQSKIECQRLRLISKQSLPHIRALQNKGISTASAYDCLAEENVVLTAATPQGLIYATAAEARYDAFYEVVSVVGSPHRPATIDKQSTMGGGNPITAELLSGDFNLKSGETTFQPLRIRSGQSAAVSIPSAPSGPPPAAEVLPGPRAWQPPPGRAP